MPYAGGVKAIIFGDSYVAAADRGRPGYARLTPLLLGWRGEHAGLGGTGFVKTAGDRGAYPSRLPELLARHADTVIIQASGNDAPCDLEDVRVAAKDFLTTIAGRFPRVVMLGPMWAKDGAENLPALSSALAAVCDEQGIQFIDALGWLSPRLIGPDGAHPTRLGHAVIAARLAWALRR